MLKIGQLVMLVGTDGYAPTFGSIGEVLGWDGEDYEVEFPKHPCPTIDGSYWCCPPSWLMPINGDQPETNTEHDYAEYHGQMRLTP